MKEILKNASDNNCKEVSQKVVENRQSCSKRTIVHHAFLWHQCRLKQLAPFHGSLCFAGIAGFAAMVSHSGEQILLERSGFFLGYFSSGPVHVVSVRFMLVSQ